MECLQTSAIYSIDRDANFASGVKSNSSDVMNNMKLWLTSESKQKNKNKIHTDMD